MIPNGLNFLRLTEVYYFVLSRKSVFLLSFGNTRQIFVLVVVSYGLLIFFLDGSRFDSPRDMAWNDESQLKSVVKGE